jgi:xanthine dehydrogenase iron-sulfur cluster and FAD-binding subunit A
MPLPVIMWHEYFTPSTIDEAIRLLAERGPRARLVAGATDLILELERGARPGVDTLIDITRIPGLGAITEDENGTIHLGALVTHNDCAASPLIRAKAYPLARAAWEEGAPQIRNRATVAGNLITASPANDTIPPLMALGAILTLTSVAGTRRVPLGGFYTGVRKTVMKPEEILVDIAFEGLRENQRGTFIKLALRRAQAISVVDAALVLTLSPLGGRAVETATITLGSVAPTIIHASTAEEYLTGKSLDEDVILRAAELASGDSRPIDDLRGSASYRREMVRVVVMRGLRSIRDGREMEGMPTDPVTLSGGGDAAAPQVRQYGPVRDIRTTINGQERVFTTGQHKTLLRFLREEAGLTGTKEGCAEGECGACTVFLDGQAVMACMVPAPRADGAEIVTVEGLTPTQPSPIFREAPPPRAENGAGQGRGLHPIQQAFIQTGAVQCGYCTPGFLMSGAKLLQERPHPTRNEIEQALTGNLCRCTGYYKIIQAIEQAAAASEVTYD